MIYKGEKGLLQKAKEKISRKIRGKEKTNVKGIEQDTKTGALTHNAPKDRMDTKDGRIYYNKIRALKFGQKSPKIPKGSNDMSYAERKKEIAADKKEAKRKAAFDKKYVTKKAAGGRVNKANGGRTNYRGGGLATSGYGKVMKS